MILGRNPTAMEIIANWDEMMNKQAKGGDDLELGEIKEIGPNYVLAEKKGTLRTEKFYLPKELAERFDGSTLWFNVTKDEARLKLGGISHPAFRNTKNTRRRRAMRKPTSEQPYPSDLATLR